MRSPDALLLAPCRDVHTFGMRKPIDVAFVSADGIVLSSYRAVGRRRRLRCERAAVTLERFASNEPWLRQGDHLTLGGSCEDTVREGSAERMEGNEDMSGLPSQGVR